jgi:hypothetical protein
MVTGWQRLNTTDATFPECDKAATDPMFLDPMMTVTVEPRTGTVKVYYVEQSIWMMHSADCDRHWRLQK